MLSPGVFVEEIDASTIVPSVSMSVAVFGGDFTKGPTGDFLLISSTDDLIDFYGLPTDENYNQWYQCYNFLQYGNTLYVSRASNEASLNSSVAIKKKDPLAVNSTIGLVGSDVNLVVTSALATSITITNTVDAAIPELVLSNTPAGTPFGVWGTSVAEQAALAVGITATYVSGVWTIVFADGSDSFTKTTTMPGDFVTVATNGTVTATSTIQYA